MAIAMSQQADETDLLNLGRQLRALREARGLSLRALATKVEVTASFLSQVERGLCSPSLATLRHLAAQLEVPVFQLLVEYEVSRPIVRADERVTINLPESPVTYELLSSGSARVIEMFIVKVDQPGVNLVRRLAIATEECLHVLSGTMEIEFGGNRHTVEAGDSVTYEGRSLAWISSAGSEQLVLIAAVTPPTF